LLCSSFLANQLCCALSRAGRMTLAAIMRDITRLCPHFEFETYRTGHSLVGRTCCWI